MHIRRGLLGWGVFLILAGAVPLALRAGYLTSDQIGRLWTLWPLILIGIGVGLVLNRTRFDFLGGLIVAATLGLIAGGLLGSGVGPLSTSACGQEAGTVPFPARQGAFSGPGTVDLQVDCGNLTVGVGSDRTWRVEGRDAKGAGPEINATDVVLRVRSRDDGGAPWVFGARDAWQVTIPAAGPLDLDVQLDAGLAVMHLDGAAIGTFGLKLNAGAATVDLGAATGVERIDAQLNAGSLGLTLPGSSTTGTIRANAGSVKLCAAPGVGLKLHTGESVLAGYDYGGHGLTQDGSTWTTPGFDDAAVKIELQTQANAGSFALNPEDGCD